MDDNKIRKSIGQVWAEVARNVHISDIENNVSDNLCENGENIVDNKY